MLDLNKNLKEISEQCESIFRSFKKIQTNLSSFVPKKDPDHHNIHELLKRINSFKEDIENNKYSVVKGQHSQPKIEIPSQAPWLTQKTEEKDVAFRPM